MLDHAREAVCLAQGKTREDLDSDRLLNLALVRLLEIVGEAASSGSRRSLFPALRNTLASDRQPSQPAHSRTPVKTIVGYYKPGLSMEEVLEGLPHLTPAQIYEALSYHHDHPAQIEQGIEESRMERLVKRSGLKIMADGRIPPEEGREP